MLIILSILSYQVGSGIFDPSLGDPEHCHATNTTSWELSLAARHYHPSSQTMARHILARCPSQGESSCMLYTRTSVIGYGHLKLYLMIY